MRKQESLFSAELQGAFDMDALLERIPDAPRPGTVVTGEVVMVSKSGYFVSIGLKGDCLVTDAEPGELEVGKSYQFAVLSELDPEDEVFKLSYKLAAAAQAKQAADAKRKEAWTLISSCLESGEIIGATVHADPKIFVASSKKNGSVGGLNVMSLGVVKSFIPRGELVVHGKLESFAGKTIPVVVIAADAKKGEVILSHARAIERLRAARFDELSLGQIVDGTVVHILDSGEGVLVDVGGELTGLVYRTEVSGNRNIKPSAVLKVGDRVQVKVTELNMQKRSISLSIRQAAQEAFVAGLKEGDIIDGIVARFENYGTFVMLGGCIDGLLHNVDAGVDSAGRREKLTVNQEVRVRVLKIDRERSANQIHISLSRKGITEN